MKNPVSSFKIVKTAASVAVVMLMYLVPVAQVQLRFTGTPTRSGTAGAVGTTYTYSNIGTMGGVTIRGVFEIISRTSNATLQNIDASSGGSDNAWQPVINGSTTSAGNCWNIRFRLSFFTSAGAPLTLSSFRAHGVDIDGDDGNLREFNEFEGASGFFLETPSNLSVTNTGSGFRFTSPRTQYSGIVLTQTNVIVTCLYQNTNSIFITLGSCCVGGSCSATGTNRQYSINFFDAVTYANQAVLPVNFISVGGRKLATGNSITWKVSEESNLKEYVVERSTDGKAFVQAGIVPHRPTSNQQNEYSFLDPFIAKTTLYYRVKSVDHDESVRYSPSVKLTNTADRPGLTILNNPVPGTLRFGYVSTETLQIQTRIMGVSGQVIQTKSINVQKGTNLVELSGTGELRPGLYFLSVDDKDNGRQVIKWMKI